jgi:Sec-independent protein translocase protein TatA
MLSHKLFGLRAIAWIASVLPKRCDQAAFRIFSRLCFFCGRGTVFLLAVGNQKVRSAHGYYVVADYINSTEKDSRVRRKLGKAIKRFRQVKDEDFAHAQNDFKHANDDLAAAIASFEHLVQDFSHAIGDFSESGRDPAHAREDRDHAEGDFDAAEEKLQHAIKDIRHAVKDFSQALKDLEQIEDMAEQIAEAASGSRQERDDCRIGSHLYQGAGIV